MSYDPIKTSDLYLAAYYRVARVPLLAAEWTGKRVEFSFEGRDPATVRDLKAQFYLDQARVPALSYSQAIRALKQIVFDVKAESKVKPGR